MIKDLKLSPLKKLMLSLLGFMINLVYHTDVFAFSQLYASGCVTSSSACNTCCVNSGYAAGYRGYELKYSTASDIDAVKISDYGYISSTSCYCFSSSTLSAVKACRATMCSTQYANAEGKFRYVTQAYQCVGLDDCACPKGTYYSSNGSCEECNAGYYCIGGSLTSATETQCGPGFVCSNTGMVSATQCAKGFYCPGTINTAETACPLSSLGATTLASGAASISSCYMPPNIRIANEIGTYKFVDNCYYS